MPYLDGYQVMEQMGSVIPAQSFLPILVLTADATREAKQRALQMGAKDFLTKPLDYMEVMLRIQNLLETRILHLQQQNQTRSLEEKIRERTVELRRQTERATALARTAERLNANSNLSDVLQTVCQETIAALPAPAIAISLLCSQRQEYILAAEIGLPPMVREGYQPISLDHFSGMNSSSDKALLIEDLGQLHLLPQFELFLQAGFRSLATARMERDGDVIGQLIAIGIDQPLSFSDDELFLLQAVADQAAQAISNARFYEKLQNYAAELEERVAERTTALRLANQQLQTANDEVVRALEQEKELNELKSRFLSMASHEFRTPLTTILSSSELLQRYAQRLPEEKQKTHHQRIQTSVRHMTTLVDQVLTVEKNRTGHTQFSPVAIDLASFCADIVDEFRLGAAAQHHLTLQLEGTDGDGCIQVEMDPELLRRILHNLLSNAVKYAPASTQISLRVSQCGEKTHFFVSDEGIGIPQQDQARLFQFFHRAANVGVISGTGLGLYIVKQAVNQHGGNIRVESEEGKGSAFYVELPTTPERK